MTALPPRRIGLAMPAVLLGAGALAALLVIGAWRLGRAPSPADVLPSGRLSVAAALTPADPRGFARALAPRPFVFPADHGSHPEYHTEWWYYTGNLTARDGRRLGFQLTFFRSALAPPPAPPAPAASSSPASPPSLPRSPSSPRPPSSPRAPSSPRLPSSPRPPSSPRLLSSARPAPPPRPASSPSAPSPPAARPAPATLLPAAPAGGRASAWATNQVWLAHFAVTDAAGRRFLACERWERQALGLAGARASPFRVWVGPWSATAAGPEAAGTAPMRLVAFSKAGACANHDVAGGGDADGGETGSDAAIDLVLTAELPPVPQGDRGFSAKSGEAGNASYYYSMPRLAAAGTLRLGAERLAVSGSAWMDREWSTSSLAAGEVGWDWFALQLDDGWELMLYRLRRRPPAAAAGPATPGAPTRAAPAGPAAPGAPPRATATAPAGPAAPGAPARAAATAGVAGLADLADPVSLVTLIAPDGRTERFPLAALRFTATGAWTSPASHARYPAAWHLTLPAAGPDTFDLNVLPLLADQELRLSFRYWEGAVTARGTHGGRPVTARGYVELTGYGDAGAPPTRPTPAPALPAAGASARRSQPLH